MECFVIFVMAWWCIYAPFLSRETLTSPAAIPHYKLGKKLFFKKEEIDEWIYANKVKTRQDIENEANEYIARKRNPFR